jgi:formylglycine-generating enzyme required for sulfatase activity/tRNA A-37 threonylcarbamoyl transferase component Bud32
MSIERSATDRSGESPPSESPDSSAFESLLRRVAGGLTDPELPQPELIPGTVIGDRFELVREIGRGGFARVFEARDRVLSRQVAIKLLRRRRQLRDAELALFYREARATARLNHPHIVTAHDWGVWNDMPFLVLELLDGEPLERRLASGPIDDHRAWEIIRQIADALAYAHGLGVLHLDLKTQNVFVLRDGWIKVLDFGLAGLDWAEDIPGQVERVAGGTPGTMAPEQQEGGRTDGRTDLWAVGVILHQLLFGRRPDKLAAGEDHVPVPRGASPLGTRVLGRTLCRDPGARYPDAGALMQDLGTVRRQRSRRSRLLVGVALALSIFGVAFAGGRMAHGRQDQTWLRAEVLPEIRRLVDSGQVMAAHRLALKANRVLPEDPELRAAWGRFATPVTIDSRPPGAKVFWREPGGRDPSWELLGATPLRIPYPRATLLLRLELPGYRPYEAAPAFWGFESAFPLDRAETIPDGMIHVPGGQFGPGPEDEELELDDFLIDRDEVTNRRFKAFVDAGGYRRPELWREPFVMDGRELGWAEAIARFTDGAGHPGPQTWTGGTYPRGQDDYPVAGVSWYEAMAYAAFEGRELPTVFHWRRAAMGPGTTGSVVAESNFSNQGPAPVGQYPGLSQYGARDMAGNVREWCLNEAAFRPGARLVVGGGWDDPTYAFTAIATHSPWDRSLTNGFRLVTYAGSSKNLEAARRPFEGPGSGVRDYTQEKPVDDAEFRILRRQYEYDRRPLNATVAPGPSTRDWIGETVQFDAAYGHERVLAHLFLPRNGKPPYQTIIFWTGASALVGPNGPPTDSSKYAAGVLEFYLGSVGASGRAVMFPVFRGLFERPSELRNITPNGSVAYRDATIQWMKDLRRSIDYLETRKDIDPQRIGFFGVSWGGMLGGLAPAVEPRLKVAVLYVAGLYHARPLPEADPFNFLPRVTIPVLMINGRYDDYYPLETSQEPMYRFLGTPTDQKRYLVHESGHLVPPSEMTLEALAWYDRYLGSVSSH